MHTVTRWPDVYGPEALDTDAKCSVHRGQLSPTNYYLGVTP